VSVGECDEPLTTGDVESLRAGAELARAHVLDHALAKRANNGAAHCAAG
jgi:hypothetical protein